MSIIDLPYGNGREVLDPRNLKRGQEAPGPSRFDEGIDLEDALAVLDQHIREAFDFVESKLAPEWEKAEVYYNGGSKILKEHENRTRVSEHTIQAASFKLEGSLLRIFTGSQNIVRWKRSKIPHLKPVIAAQNRYVNDKFWEIGGFKFCDAIIQEALIKKFAVGKLYAYDNFEEDFRVASNVTMFDIQDMEASEDVTVLEVLESTSGDEMLSDVKYTVQRQRKEIALHHCPLAGFFVNEESDDFESPRVIGETSIMPVHEAIQLGIPADEVDWSAIDAGDVESERAMTAEAEERRQFHKDMEIQSYERDITMRPVRITETYCQFDLEGTGIPQWYRFFHGGSSLTYLYHERVRRHPYHLFHTKPRPGSITGMSTVDVLQGIQDTMTSLLRSMVDNAHLQNNPRMEVHDTNANFADVLSSALSMPIRSRVMGSVRPLEYPSTLHHSLPILQDLRAEADNRIGVTNAAMGLDPSALQSTDEKAVDNTIQLALTQVEAMARHLAQGGFTTLFKELLILSIEHLPDVIETYVDGEPIEISQEMFNPSIPMEPGVGLGVASQAEIIAQLDQVIAYQKELMLMDPDNGFVTIENHRAAINDRAEMLGVDMSRYFTQITQEQLMQKQAEKAERQAQAAQGQDPTAGLVQVEQIKQQGNQATENLKAQVTGMKAQLDAQQKELDRQHDQRKQVQQIDADREKQLRQIELDRERIDVTSDDKEMALDTQLEISRRTTESQEEMAADKLEVERAKIQSSEREAAANRRAQQESSANDE